MLQYFRMAKKGFEHLETIYRNYDIRGKFPEQITPEEVEKIGHAIVKRFNCKKIAVGYDNRPSSPILKDALTKGICEAGCDVVDLGLVTTPMTYFVSGATDTCATVMITASHMPSEYNGLKITTGDSVPVDADMLQELRKIVGEHTHSSSERIGVIEKKSPTDDWKQKFLDAHSFSDKKLRVVIDPANMIGVLEIDTFKQFEPWIEVFTIYDELDHTTPNHEANPIKPETLKDLGKKVVEFEADLGVAFDGDADRVGFVDEKGNFVSADLAGALIAKRLLKDRQPETIIYDLRSSDAVRDAVQGLGGTALEWKVGHTNMRAKMRELNAIMGIELAGHYFFRETHFSEGGPLPAFLIMELLHDSDKSFSELVTEINPYHHSSEINSELKRSIEEVYEELKSTYVEAEISDLDGLKFRFDTWWFNVRPSANDPVLRLNAEAETKEELDTKVAELLKIIRS